MRKTERRTRLCQQALTHGSVPSLPTGRATEDRTAFIPAASENQEVAPSHATDICEAAQTKPPPFGGTTAAEQREASRTRPAAPTLTARQALLKERLSCSHTASPTVLIPPPPHR